MGTKRNVSMKAGRGGFVVILVAALAGVAFLIGATLIAMMELSSTTNQYEQRMSLARDNAQVALKVALGDMQTALGQDQAHSYLADAYKGSPKEAVQGQAHWLRAATKLNDGTYVERWLVSQPDDALADATVATPGPKVKLLGAGTATDDASQADVDVWVPLASIKTIGLDGYAASDELSIGRYAYWVGDSGMKASYGLADRTDDVQHEPYDDAEKQNRLRQMRASHPKIPEFNPNQGKNPELIDGLVSDFQLREQSDPDLVAAYLEGLSINKIRKGFHDFTALSRGLIVDTTTGEFRKNISADFVATSGEYDEELRQYENIPDALAAELKVGSSGALSRTYPIGATDGTRPSIAPALTGFAINVGLFADYDTSGKTGELRVAYNVNLELWNPYSSSLEQVREIRARVKGLPLLEGSFLKDGAQIGVFSLNLKDETIISGPDYQIAPGKTWSPGELAVYVGRSDSSALELGEPNASLFREASYAEGAALPVFAYDPGSHVYSAEFATSGSVIEVELSEVVDGEIRILGSYAVGASSVAPDAGLTDLEPSIGATSFSFGWEVSDAALASETYHPKDGFIAKSDLIGYAVASPDDFLKTPAFEEGNAVILGRGPSSGDYPVLLELPRQELTSVSMLGMGESSRPLLGDVGAAGNELFDSVFFATNQRSATTPTALYALPNGMLKPIRGTVPSDLEDADAAHHLFLEGAFNVNSTSVEAWKAVLKGISLGEWDYVGKVGAGPFAVDEYQFLNFPQSAEETYNLAGPVDPLRAAYRRGVISLTENQVDILAVALVARIRSRIQSESGPTFFRSVKDFLDSGVLQGAIDDTNLNAGIPKHAPAYLSQRTIMNAIGNFLSARSDTFLIRAYGDAVNPAAPGEIWVRAYCEAVVQRMHEPRGDAFGRPFRVVAFRWLEPGDI